MAPTRNNKPKLEKLSTPVTANFPSEVTSAVTSAHVRSATTATPLSAITFPLKPDPDYIKTPISPPVAYTDFLSKLMPMASPPPPSGQTTPESCSSERSDCSCKVEVEEASPTTTPSESEEKACPPSTAPLAPPSPYPFRTLAMPMSAPPTGPDTFPSLKVPPSPSIINLDSPLRSPWSARSTQPHSAFDWDAALKARTQTLKKKSARTSTRHIREVVTRTVTYTPRMDPAPKGKRRKVE